MNSCGICPQKHRCQISLILNCAPFERHASVSEKKYRYRRRKQMPQNAKNTAQREEAGRYSGARGHESLRVHTTITSPPLRCPVCVVCVCRSSLLTARRREQHVGLLHGGGDRGDPTIVTLQLATEDQVVTRTGRSRHGEREERREEAGVETRDRNYEGKVGERKFQQLVRVKMRQSLKH
jgi:hypothetical protein